jgi:hypothetical protein
LQEESYLAGVDGMNAFAAAAILSQISLHDFLALSPDQRLQLAPRIPVAEGMIVGSNTYSFLYLIIILTRNDSTRLSLNDVKISISTSAVRTVTLRCRGLSVL